MCFVCISHGMRAGEYSGHISAGDAPASSGVNTAAFSGNVSYTDALMEGISWTGTKGQAATVAYSFGFSEEGGATLTASQQAQALQAMQAWSNVANITFQSSFFADLTFSQENLGSGVLGLTTTFFSGDQILSSEVQIDDSVVSLTTGTLGYLVLLHEIGHAIGLKHPGDYGTGDQGPFLPSAEDSLQYSVMSYNNSSLIDENSNPPSTPMLYDIAAIQEIYGANTSYNNGNTAYAYNGSQQVMAIWDGGGNDTLSASSYLAGGSTLDLREGAGYVSYIGQAIVQVAFGANIEHAVGTILADSITGNSSANQLFGGNGNDTVRGGSGADTIYGGDGVADADDGTDVMAGEDGADLIYGNTGNDTLYGGVGIADAESSSDTLYGGYGTDALYGNSGNDALYGGGNAGDPTDLGDTIYGGFGSDSLYGNGGNDILYGGGNVADPSDGSDLIYAGFGDDTLYGNGGNDTLIGQNGNDVMHAGVGNDVYVFHNESGVDVIQHFEGAGSAGGDVIQLQSNINGSGISLAAQAVAAMTLASDGSGILNLGNGHIVTIWGVGLSLTADDFSFI